MRRTPWWVWVAVLMPFGFGAWATIVPSVQRRKAWWLFWSGLFTALIVAAVAVSDIAAEGVTGTLALVAWGGGIATALSIRGPFLAAQQPSEFELGRGEAERRLTERREALQLAAAQPQVAREMGVGRPDVPGARHAYLVDVNHAGAGAFAYLPGIDAALAKRLVRVREEVNGFGSLAELGAVMDLDGHLVERLRDLVVFLPR